MKDAVLLNIRGIQYSQTRSGSYALILEDAKTDRHLPIIIGGAEAQAIALGLEKDLQPTRPLTHDLFANVAKSFHIHMNAVYIHKLEDGIFYANISLEQDGQTEEIDSRTSDAIALAVRYQAPIYASAQVMSEAGIHLSEAQEEESVQQAIEQIEEELVEMVEGAMEEFGDLTNEALEEMLAVAVKEEDYERAAKIRDVLEKRKS